MVECLNCGWLGLIGQLEKDNLRRERCPECNSLDVDVKRFEEEIGQKLDEIQNALNELENDKELKAELNREVEEFEKKMILTPEELFRYYK